jgi:hypothetical protein
VIFISIGDIMGRRWWQKEARAKAAQEQQAAKEDVVALDEVSIPEAITSEAVSNDETAEVSDSIDESVAILAQTVEDAVINETSDTAQDDDAIEEESDVQVDDVKVAGITITHSSNAYQNIKKKRRN